MILDHFVGRWPDAYPKAFCVAAQVYLDLMDKQGFVRAGGGVIAPIDVYQAVNDPFWQTAYPAYLAEYGILQSLHTQAGPSFEIRRRPAGAPDEIQPDPGGPRQWSLHVLEWLVFLDDVLVGGELVFDKQGLTVPATAGTLVVWPSAFTHAHRLCSPRSGDQHVLRGWVEVA